MKKKTIELLQSHVYSLSQKVHYLAKENTVQSEVISQLRKYCYYTDLLNPIGI